LAVVSDIEAGSVREPAVCQDKIVRGSGEQREGIGNILGNIKVKNPRPVSICDEQTHQIVIFDI
jgi:hypothetical protein